MPTTSASRLGRPLNASLNNGRENNNTSMALKKFLADMRNQNFDDIKLATYRTTAKLLHIQTRTSLNHVDIYNMIESFRENGLNTLCHDTEIDEMRLECIVSSIYFALFKRLPSSHLIDIEEAIMVLTQWLLYVYDSDGRGTVRVLSVKTALSTLCAGRLIDKLRYVFTQVSNQNGTLDVVKFDAYLREVLMLPAAIGEEPNFGYSYDAIDSFFKPEGPLNKANTEMEDFLGCLLFENATGILHWIQMYHKITKASHVEHHVACKVCNKKPFTGLRYKCLHCYNFHLCQECFWRQRATGTHKPEHEVREYSTWNKGERGTSVRKKILCSPSKSNQQLPDYPKEPKLNNTLDMANIVPPLPSDLPPPMATPKAKRPFHASQSDTLSSRGTNDSGQLSQEAVSRMDDEHRLIARYALRLAGDHPDAMTTGSLRSDTLSPDQRNKITELQDKNRNLLLEIRRLKIEHEETLKSSQQLDTDPDLLTELRQLRLRKDELELRMSALQETRRELMVQLEGLMKLLKSSSGKVQLTQTSSFPGYSSPPPQGSLSGVNGDVKEAFSKSTSPNTSATRKDLRGDLLKAVDSVTGAMTTLVDELSKEDVATRDKASARSHGDDDHNNNSNNDRGKLAVETNDDVTAFQRTRHESTPLALKKTNSNSRYEKLTRDLDMIMDELSSTGSVAGPSAAAVGH